MALFAAQALEAMKKAVGVGDPTTPLGQAILRALKEIGKQVGGAPPPETQANSLQSQLVEAKRSAMQRIALQQMHQQGGGAALPVGGAPPGVAPPPGGAPPPSAAAA